MHCMGECSRGGLKAFEFGGYRQERAQRPDERTEFNGFGPSLRGTRTMYPQ